MKKVAVRLTVLLHKRLSSAQPGHVSRQLAGLRPASHGTPQIKKCVPQGKVQDNE